MRWALALLLAGVLLVVLALVAVTLARPTIDVDRWRSDAERELSAVLGRAVTVGHAELRWGLTPRVTLRDLRIANALGFSNEPFLAVDTAVLEVDPAAALRAHYTVREARLVGVRLSLESFDTDGKRAARNNWTLKPKSQTAQPKGFLSALPLDTLARLVVEEAQITDLQLRRLVNGREKPLWRLPRATLRAPEDQPLVFEAEGGCKPDGCGVQVEAAALSELGAISRGERTDWPVRLNARSGARVLAFQGVLRADSLVGQLAAAVPQARQDLAQWGVKLGRDEAQAQPLSAGLAADLSLTTEVLEIRNFTATFGSAVATGQWRTQFGARPKVDAAIQVNGLDDTLETLLNPRGSAAPSPKATAVKPQGLRRLYDSLSAVEIDFDFLQRVDARLNVAVPRFHALGVEADAVQLTAQLQAGALRAPLSFSLWGTPFEAILGATGGTLTSARLNVQTRQVDVGLLARRALGSGRVNGSADQLVLELGAQGHRLSQWVRSLDVLVLLTNARLQDAADPSRRAEVRQLAVRWAGEQALAGSLNAQVMGHPLQATLAGNALDDLLRNERLSVSLTMRSDDITLDASASVSALGQAKWSLQALWVDLQVPRAAAVAGWFGLNTRADRPLSLRALMLARPDALTLPMQLQIGKTTVSATLTQPQGASASLPSLAIHVPQLHVDDIDALIPTPQEPMAVPPQPPAPAAAGIPARATPRDANPPRRWALADGLFSVQVDNVAGSRVPLTGLRFAGQLRAGQMPPSPLVATVDRKPLTGAIGLDLRASEPQVAVWLRAEQPDMASLARRLALNPPFELAFDEMTLQLQVQAARLADWPAKAQVLAAVNGGRFALRDAALARSYSAAIEQGVLSVRPAEPVRFSLAARANGQTATLTLQSASLPVLLNTADPVPLIVRADLGSHWVELDARAARTSPALSRTALPPLSVRLKAGGQQLSELDRAVGVALPPWGPWSLESAVSSQPGEHRLRGLQLQVGSSRVSGSASWIQRAATAGSVASKPLLEVDLHSNRIALADFPLGTWSPVQAPAASTGLATPAPATTPRPVRNTGVAQQAARAADAGNALLAAGTLEQQDVRISLRLDNLVFGGNGPERDQRLGAGALTAQVINGNLIVGPAMVSLPGGTASLDLRFLKVGESRNAQFALEVPRFDYSSLARWYAPQALRDSRGEVSLSVQASATVAELAQLPAQGNGHVRARLYPKSLSSQRIDIWAVNLLTALLPAVDPSGGPQVNCAVADWQLAGGRLRHQRLALDTTGMRVTGEGQIDLLAPAGGDAFALRFQPQAKEAQFFSLATPVSVSGPLLQPKVGVAVSDVAATALRLATSFVWVPLQKLAGRSLPADGADLCGAR